LLDIIVSLSLFVSFPVSIFIVKKPLGYFLNIFKVLFGRYSWVSYTPSSTAELLKLPKIRKGVLDPTYSFKNRTIEPEAVNRLNLLYARNYKFTNDLNIIYKGFKSLGSLAAVNK